MFDQYAGKPEELAKTKIGSGERASLNKCPLRRNGVPADQEFCTQTGFVVSRNAENCTKYRCSSKWRICYKCAVEVPKPSAEHAAVVDSNSGLCAYHQAEEKGDAEQLEKERKKRDPDGVRLKKPVRETLPQPPPPPKEKVEEPAPAFEIVDHKPKEVATPLQPIREDITPEPEDEEDDERVGHIRRIIEKYKDTPPVTLSLHEVEPDPDQPRSYFDPAKMVSLTASIKAVGQTDPGLVIEKPGGGYKLVDGERRYRACKEAGEEKYLAWICEPGEAAVLFAISVMKNFNREGHTPIETARMLKRMQEDFGYNMKAISALIGQPYHFVTFYMKLNNLKSEVVELMDADLPEENRLTSSAANHIAKLPHELQLEAAKTVLERKLRAQQVPQFVRAFAEGRGAPLRTRRIQPSDKWDTLSRRFDRVLEILEWYEEAPPDEFANVVRGRSEEEQATMRELLENIAQSASALHAGISDE